MQINVSIKQGNKEIDIIADENRRIKDVIKELYVQGLIPEAGGSFMRSSSLERVVSTENSFRDEGISSGDKLAKI